MMYHKYLNLSEPAYSAAIVAIKSQAKRSACDQSVEGAHIQGEICGVIVDIGGHWQAIELPNHSDDSSFFALGSEFEQYRDQAIGIYHSHYGDDGSGLSDMDIANCVACNIPYIVYHADFEKWDYFDPNALHPYPLELDDCLGPSDRAYYERWRFQYGRSDCWRLIRAWYAGMLSIEAGDHARVALTPRHLQFSADRAEKQGFKPYSKDAPLQDHDVILFDAFGGRSNHVGVIIDATKNLLLHSIGEGHCSVIERYDQSWRDRARTIYRHREVIA